MPNDPYTKTMQRDLKNHLFSVLLICFIGCQSFAQPDQPQAQNQPETTALTQDQVQKQIEALETIGNLDAATKEAASNLYREALDALAQRAESAAKVAEFDRLTAGAPELLASIRAELAKPPAPVQLNLPQDPTLIQLEQGLNQAQSVLLSARTESTELAAESTRRDERREVLANRLTELRKKLDEIEDTINAQVATDASPVANAQRTLQQARREAVLVEIQAFEAERASYDARVELLPARRDRAVRRVTAAQAAVDAWQTKVTQARKNEASEAANQARQLAQEIASTSPALKEFADENTRLANLRTGTNGTTQTLDALANSLSSTRQDLVQLRAGYNSVQRRIRAAAPNRATGLLLRNQYADLKNPVQLRQDLRTTQKELEKVELRRIELQEQREGAGDISKVTQDLIAAVNASETDGPIDMSVLDEYARRLATNRRDALDSLIVDASKESQLRIDLAAIQQTLLDSTVAYHNYIEERILWIRSIADGQFNFGRSLNQAGAWCADPGAWGQTVKQVLTDAKANPFRLLIVIFGIVLAFLVRRFSRIKLFEFADLVRSYRTDSMRWTALGFMLTLGANCAIPTIFILIAWLLHGSSSAEPAVAAISASVLKTSPMIVLAFFAFASMRTRGLFAAHFRWPQPTVRHIRNQMAWYLPIVVPLVILGHAINNAGNDDFIASAGRVVFTTHMIALAVFVMRVFKPAGPAMAEYLSRQPNRFIGKTVYFWYGLAIGIPLLFIVLSWIGYHYTVIHLFAQVQQSLMLVFTLIVAYAIMSRWLFVNRRRVASAAAKRKREMTEADMATSAESGVILEEEELNLPAISAQTQQIFRAVIFISAIVGLFSIWSPVLPALRMLDRVELWPQVRVVSDTEDEGVPILETTTPIQDGVDASRASTSTVGQPTGDSNPGSTGGTAPGTTPTITPLTTPLSTNGSTKQADTESPEEPPHIITLTEVALAIVVLFATWLSFRNLPGLLEIVVLPRLPLDAGSRYALSTVVRYAIAIIGFSIAFSVIGLSWGKVQWLAAALTFGLAFGLQEIFANFVSGLIILAERPIRIGDSVTVGGVTGDVSRIRMRATTILDWDNKELVIPNKTFITGDVINWTLTDPILRAIINVGVSYSADVDHVVRVLKKIAAAEPTVLQTPPSTVFFKEFGDSTLNFELRVYIPSVRNWVSVKHVLNMTIMKTFKEEGIEIAFPQRDLHIRSAESPIRIVREQVGGQDIVTLESDQPQPE